MSKFASEVDLMRPLVEWLRARRDVVRENLHVNLHGQFVSPDVVTIRKTEQYPAFYDVYEGKLELNDAVVNQARRWRPYCHRTWIVVPTMELNTDQRRLRRRLLAMMNLGLIYIDARDGKVRNQDQPKHYTTKDPDLSMLEVAMETSPPASTDKPAGAPSVQPSRALRKFGDVIRYVESNGPTTVKALILAGVLHTRKRMQLLNAIENRDIGALEYTGPKGYVQLVKSEVTT